MPVTSGSASTHKLAARVKGADVLLVIGERLGEITTSGYTLLDAPMPTQTLVHVYPMPTSWATSINPRSPSQRRRWRSLALNRRDAAVGAGSWAPPSPKSARIARRGERRDRFPARSTWQIVSWLDARLPTQS